MLLEERAQRRGVGIGVLLRDLIHVGLSHDLAAEQARGNRLDSLVGDWEFDMSEMGMGTIILNVYVEGESLWAWPDTSSEPSELGTVEGEPFKFFIEDAEEGRYNIVFLKDENGKYTKCRVTNEGMGMDATGIKAEK